MGADKNSSRRRWGLQQDEYDFQHTSPTRYPSCPSPRNHWNATGPRNQQTTLQHAHRKLAWLAACAAPVRPVDTAGRPVATAAAQQVFQRASVTYLGPGKNTPKAQPAWKKNPTQSLAKQLQNRPKTDQQYHDPRTHESSSSPRANPTSGLHWPDRSCTPVRPVKPGQLGMNNTRGSTPPNPNLDLSNRSTDLCKTLGIVETPHEESIAKLLSTKTSHIKRN
jgi:hypothetical protein